MHYRAYYKPNLRTIQCQNGPGKYVLALLGILLILIFAKKRKMLVYLLEEMLFI